MTYVQSNASSFWQFEQRYYNVRSFDSNFAPIAITEEDESKELHSTLYYVPKTLKTVNITNETVFGYGAFMNCDWLQNFYYHYIDYSDYNFAGNYSAIPDEQVTTITKIDDYAFFNMGGLLGSSFQRNGNKQTSAIALHDEVSTNNTYGFFGTEEYIGDYAFALIDNENFINLVLPASLTYIGKYSFSNCANLESVNVKSNILGTYTFGYSPKLKNVIFNSDIETLDEGVFFECKQLFNIELTDKIKYINDYAFYNCDSLGTLNSTGTIDLKSVEHLGSYAFSDCDSLINITIPNSVIKILSHTFEHCIYLEKITLQNACMGSYMFAFNDSLETVSIPSSIVKIDDHAFTYCANLKNVEYASKIIGDYMFYGVGRGSAGFTFNFNTEDLPDSNVTNYVYITSDITRVGEFAFALISEVETIKFENVNDKAANQGDASENNYLGDFAFAFTSITEIELPNSVTYIGEGLVAGCQLLDTITLPFVGSRLGK